MLHPLQTQYAALALLWIVGFENNPYEVMHKLSKQFNFFIQSLLVLGMMASTQAALAYDYYNGKKLYEKYCVECHGVRGQGELPNVPDFSHGESLHKSDKALIDHIRDGSGFAPAFDLSLTEREMRDILVYLRSLY